VGRATKVTNSIRALRFANGEMTQAELADRLGVTRQTIIAVEQGKYSPTLEMAFRMARVFGVPLEQVFQYPDDPRRDYIKRCVAVGGQTVEVKDKVLYVDGRARNEPYVKHIDPTNHPASFDPRDNFGPYRVPDGSLFMMGDNRDNSNDSRFWGPVKMSLVKGRAMFLYWSWDGEQRWPRFGRILTAIR